MSAGAAAYTTKRGKTKKGKLGQRKDSQSNNERRLGGPAAAFEDLLFKPQSSKVLGLLGTSEIQKRRAAALPSSTSTRPNESNEASSSTSSISTSTPSPTNDSKTVNNLLVIPPSKNAEPSVVHDRLHFPVFEDLSEKEEPNSDFFNEENGTITPAVHWCFIGEIVSVVKPKESAKVRDLDGAEVLVNFALPVDNKIDSAFDLSLLKVGRTVCVRYAESQALDETSRGIVVENPGFVYLIKSPLAQVIEVADKLNDKKQKTFTACGCCSSKASLKACAQCHSVAYCSKECQVKSWPEHKSDCTLYSGVQTLLNIDYKLPFNGHLSFKQTKPLA